MTNKSTMSLKAAQSHYTSCQYGMSGHAGFQTRAMSAKVTAEQRIELEKLAIYQLPKNIEHIDTETAEPDLTAAPIAYRMMSLSCGGFAITRSVYTGLDYTQRGGNYFAHGLIIADLEEQVWPIDICAGACWESGLLPEKDVPQDSYDLPELSISPMATPYGFEHLQSFLKQFEHAEVRLEAMIQAVFCKAQSDRSLVIRDSSFEHGPYWIACLQKSFPCAIQHLLSYSSYQYDPRACLDINVVCGQTDFTFTPTERKYQFYIFDFDEGVCSEVEPNNTLYAKTVAHWMIHEPHTLAEFHQFSGLFYINSLNADFDMLVKVFQLKAQQLGKKDVDELLLIIEFINTYAKPAHLAQVVGLLSAYQDILAQVVDPQQLEKITLFFIHCYQVSHCSVVKALIVKQLSRLTFVALTSDLLNIDMVSSLKAKAYDVDPEINRLIDKLFLSEQFFVPYQSVIASLNDGEMVGLSTAYMDIIRASEACSSPIKSTYWQAFMAQMVAFRYANMSQSEWLFCCRESSSSDIADVIIEVYRQIELLQSAKQLDSGQCDKALDGFIYYLESRFDGSNSDWFSVVNKLKELPAMWPMLSSHWHATLNTQKQKVVFFTKYYNAVLTVDSAYKEAFLKEFGVACWHALAAKQRLDFALFCLENQLISAYEHTLIIELVACANEAIKLAPEHAKSDEMIDLLAVPIQQYQIELSPNKVRLRQAIQSHKNLDGSQFLALRDTLEKVDKGVYREFIKVYLPMLLHRMSDVSGHQDIVTYLYLPDFSDEFKSAYDSALSTDTSAPVGKSCEGFLVFLLDMDELHPQYRHCKALCVDLLVSKFTKLNDRDLHAMFLRFRSSAQLTPEKLQLLNDMANKIEEKKNTILRKVGRKSIAVSKAIADLTKSGISKIIDRVRT